MSNKWYNSIGVLTNSCGKLIINEINLLFVYFLLKFVKIAFMVNLVGKSFNFFVNIFNLDQKPEPII